MALERTDIIRLLQITKDIMHENRDYLIELDSAVGDGDLGLTMDDGFAAAYRAVADMDETDIGKTLYFAGKAMASAVPSTMGTLMASGFMNAGKELKGATQIDVCGLHKLYQAYMDGVAFRGKAKLGEKTFLDGISPAVKALEEAAENGFTINEAAEAAYRGAKKGFDDAKNLLAVHGRLALRGELSKTLDDPGAAVAVLMMQALVEVQHDTKQEGSGCL